MSKVDKSPLRDSELWMNEYKRQFQSVKGALHSLKRQTERYRKEYAHTKAAREEMAHTFDLVEKAFSVLNTPKPPVETTEIWEQEPKGRRQFISDLKAGK